MTLRAADFWNRLPASIAESEYQQLVSDHRRRFGEHWQSALEFTIANRGQTPALANPELFEGTDSHEAMRARATDKFIEQHNQRVRGQGMLPRRAESRPDVVKVDHYWNRVTPPRG